jgi:methyltransferase-like protein
VDEIYDILKLIKPENAKPINEPASDPSLEELLAAYIQVEENEQEARWIKGQLLDEMLKRGAKQTWLSSQLGISPAQIRELVKVYRAFPKPEMRIPSLSWYHHRVAANSPDPAKYILKANDEALSTRELRKAILEDEGKEHLAHTETEQQLIKAKRIYQQVEELIKQGGEPADWLKRQLAALFDWR